LDSLKLEILEILPGMHDLIDIKSILDLVFSILQPSLTGTNIYFCFILQRAANIPHTNIAQGEFNIHNINKTPNLKLIRIMFLLFNFHDDQNF